MAAEPAAVAPVAVASASGVTVGMVVVPLLSADVALVLAPAVALFSSIFTTGGGGLGLRSRRSNICFMEGGGRRGERE